MPRVLVIGSSNTDLIIRASKLPSPGETVLGGTFFIAGGGKGANQAVAAARAGAQVTFIARLGCDDFGTQALSAFQREGIDTQWIVSDPHLPSGVAFILVDKRGENTIVVASGANAALSLDQIQDQVYKNAEICLLQLETPLETVIHAASLATKNKTRVVLNPAPSNRPAERNLVHFSHNTQSNRTTPHGHRPNSQKKYRKSSRNSSTKALKRHYHPGNTGRVFATPDQTFTYQLLRLHQEIPQVPAMPSMARCPAL